jgi:opacity protein-like surface antigen
MNGLVRAIPFFLSIVLAIPSAAFAQKSYTIALGGGAAIPVGKLADVQKTGVSGLAALAIGVADLPLGVRFDGIYNNLPADTQSGTTVNSDFRVMGVLANLIFAFSGTTAKPYIIVGGGLYNSKADSTGAKSHNNFGFNAGLGATFGVGPLAIFLESRYHSVSRNEANGGVFQFVPITAGLMF